MNTHGDVPVGKLILGPALITLAVTGVRLGGELLLGPARYFNREPGGGGALVGIAWLVPVFGALFALRLARQGRRPASLGRAFGFALLAVVLLPAVMIAGIALGLLPAGTFSFATLAVSGVVSLLAAALAVRGWPELGRVLVAYGLAARVPVAVLMLLAMLGNWGTHYDAAGPGVPAGVLSRWVSIGVVPQLTVWMWFTVALGMLSGCVACAVAGRRAATSA